MGSNILWFRNGLRLHDNPALLEAINACRISNEAFYPIFIFDGETAGTDNIGYNRMKFLLESLNDLSNQFKHFGGRLYMFKGIPCDILRSLSINLNIKQICFEQDCEPIYHERDRLVKEMCKDINIKWLEKTSRSLWNPYDVIRANGGVPPLTYQMFLHTVSTINRPPRPVNIPNLKNIKFGVIPENLLIDLNGFEDIPKPKDFGIFTENKKKGFLKWIGGETEALINLHKRLQVEEIAFRNGYYLPNQVFTNLLTQATSLSAHIRFGCLSVRKFYWDIHDLIENIPSLVFNGPHITGQLIWREYFYTMSVENPKYDKIKDNPICLNIQWYEPNVYLLNCWKSGNTGYPLIDAAMRQLKLEGWIHHTLRNTVATFLTRGGLWYNWEYGVEHFLKYLVDADWSVCAGNWLWISSSAFENLLDSSRCTCPTAISRRLDPNGEYIKRYLPELKLIPIEFIHEPWKSPSAIQKSSNCIIGINYPKPIIDISQVSKLNNNKMKSIRDALIINGTSKSEPPHCRPSNDDEIRTFFWLNNEMF